jgi:hypothetical protein
VFARRRVDRLGADHPLGQALREVILIPAQRTGRCPPSGSGGFKRLINAARCGVENLLG